VGGGPDTRNPLITLFGFFTEFRDRCAGRKINSRYCSTVERIAPRGCGISSGPPRCHDHAGIVPLLVEIVGEPAPSFGVR
jgi:hypothetical protein